MWTSVVVKVHGNSYSTYDFLDTLEDHFFEQFILHCVVDPFCLGIIFGVSLFGHAYPDSMLFQCIDILPAGILTTPV